MNLSRRQFMRRGALLAAGGLVVSGVAGVMAVPPWAVWLGEQMDKLQPKHRVHISGFSIATLENRLETNMQFGNRLHEEIHNMYVQGGFTVDVEGPPRGLLPGRVIYAKGDNRIVFDWHVGEVFAGV